MPPRGQPAQARERKCRKCGADEWQFYAAPSGKRRWWRCVPCNRAGARRSNEKRAVDAVKRLFFSAKNRAKALGTTFEIGYDDVKAAWPSDGRCPALGLRLEHGQKKMQDASPTLDRLNDAWGYEPGNIVVISAAANRAKGKLKASELERIAAWMRGRGLS